MTPSPSGRPAVAVVIPTRNRAASLDAAVRSVAGQTFTDWEVVIVDDGSTDETPEVCRALEAEFGPRLRCLRQAHAGASAARNCGVAASAALWLAFLDDDDLFMPGKLDRQLRQLATDDAQLCFTDWSVVDEAGALLLPNSGVMPTPGAVAYYPRLLEVGCNFVVTPSVMLSRDAFDAAGGFDPAMEICEDIDLWVRVARLARLTFVPEALVEVRTRTEAWFPYARSVRARAELYRRAFARDPKLPPSYHRQLLGGLLDVYAEVASVRGHHQVLEALLLGAQEVRAGDPARALEKLLPTLEREARPGP